jgi:WXXGXW repeat (2 copies)
MAAWLMVAGPILLTGCAHEPAHGHPPEGGPVAEVVVPQAPPMPRAEAISASPGASYVWIPGAWDWRGSDWVWEQGRWAYPPMPGAVWVPHRCESRNGTYVFIHGGWKY